MDTIKEDKPEYRKKKILTISLVVAFFAALVIAASIFIGVFVIPLSAKEISLESYYEKLDNNEIASVLFFENLTANILYKKDERKLGQFKKGRFISAKIKFKNEDEFIKCKSKSIEVLMAPGYELEMKVTGRE